jgi:hypothetical protein
MQNIALSIEFIFIKFDFKTFGLKKVAVKESIYIEFLCVADNKFNIVE